MQRRNFLAAAAVAAGFLNTQPDLLAGDSATKPVENILRFGLIADLHHNMFKRDQLARMTAFVDAANEAKPEFIIQLGDLCNPDVAPAVMEQWNRFAGPKHHVLGNHDMDKCDKDEALKSWGMQAPYYSFDLGGFHFVVLDKNNIRQDKETFEPYVKGNFYRAKSDAINSFDAKQLTWLADDLAKTTKPVFMFVHQPILATDLTMWGNSPEFLQVVDLHNWRAREKGSPAVVQAIFNGHDHVDTYALRNNVHYISVNSASYAYTSGAFFYEAPLFAFVTLTPNSLNIEGRTSTYTKGAPEKIRAEIPCRISSRELKLF
jgi:predicted phosphodiesterase